MSILNLHLYLLTYLNKGQHSYYNHDYNSLLKLLSSNDVIEFPLVFYSQGNCKEFIQSLGIMLVFIISEYYSSISAFLDLLLFFTLQIYMYKKDYD